MPESGIKYKKKGSIGKTQENELVLTDEAKKSYKVDDAVAVVWNMCDGVKSVDDISAELSKQAKAGKPEIKDAVLKIIAQLERFGLLQRA